MKLFVGKKFLNPEKKRRSITKKFIVFNFLLLCAFPFGHAADWAPDSLEGKFIKLIEEHEPGVEIETPDGYSYTSSYAKYIDYYYVEDGIARSGTSKDHVLSPLALSYSKTGPKSFSVDFSSEYTKLYSEKITGIMIDEKQAIATHYYEVTSLGHPYQGASINSDQMGIVLKLEFLDNKPTIATSVKSGTYSNIDWVLSEDGRQDIEAEKYYFKHLIPTDEDWTGQWVSTTPLWAESSEAKFQLELSNRLYVSWSPIGYPFLENYSSYYDISSSSKDWSKETRLRVHYKAEGKQFICEIDEDVSGNWRTFLEGSLDSGFRSILNYHPDTGEEISLLNAGQEILIYEEYLNDALMDTKTFKLFSIKPVSLTFAVGNDTLDDITSSNKADFSNGGLDSGNGWRSLDWFGYYYPSSSGWLYHLNHGWMYPVATSFESVWFYSPTHDWLWTTQTAYPWTWFHTGQSWKYYISSTNKWVSN